MNNVFQELYFLFYFTLILDKKAAWMLEGTLIFEPAFSWRVSLTVFRVSFLACVFFMADVLVTLFCVMFSFSHTLEVTKTKLWVRTNLLFHFIQVFLNLDLLWSCCRQEPLPVDSSFNTVLCFERLAIKIMPWKNLKKALYSSLKASLGEISLNIYCYHFFLLFQISFKAP